MTNSVELTRFGIVSFLSASNPTVSVVGAKFDQLFTNTTTGEIFRCRISTFGSQLWLGTSGTVVGTGSPVAFNGNSKLLRARLDIRYDGAVNPGIDAPIGAIGSLYQNTATGEIFTCYDATVGSQAWIGTQGSDTGVPLIAEEDHPNLQLMYRMDAVDITGSTLDDRSPNSRDGVITGAVNVAGLLAEALSFDGVNDFVDSGWNSSDNIGSISLWATRSVSGNTPLLSMGDTVTSTYNLALQWHTAGEVRFVVQQSPGFGNAIVVTTGTVAVDANTFHHICITNAGGVNGWKIYLDGVLQALTPSGAGNNGAWFNTTNGGADVPTVLVGANIYTSGSFYGQSKIDQLRVFDRVLTSTEVADLYNGGAGV